MRISKSHVHRPGSSTSKLVGNSLADDESLGFSFRSEDSSNFSTTALYKNQEASRSETSVVFEFDKAVQLSKPYRKLVDQTPLSGTSADLDSQTGPEESCPASHLPPTREKGEEPPPRVSLTRAGDFVAQRSPALSMVPAQTQQQPPMSGSRVEVAVSCQVVRSDAKSQTLPTMRTTISGGSSPSISLSSIGDFVRMRRFLSLRISRGNKAAAKPDEQQLLPKPLIEQVGIYRITLLGGDGAGICEFVDRVRSTYAGSFCASQC